MTKVQKNQRKRLNLALQGGGAHGAFTWGVLDRLMRDGRIFIDGISGTSAGAMNGVVFTDGFIKGGRQGAIDSLGVFWKKVSDGAFMSSQAMMPWFMPGGDKHWNVDNSPAFMMADFFSRMFSPSQLNPLNLNPLRDILSEMVDFEGLRRRKDIKLFVSASNVRTCKLKVFRTEEMSVDALLASACLPLMFKAVEIDGEQYWDGGYLANPAIAPLIHECVSKDVVIVQINPMNRPEAPTTAREILNRINEVSFNSTLVREMSGIATISKLIDQGKLHDTPFHHVNFHIIVAEDEMSQLGASSKFNADWKFLRYLYELGVSTTDKWLAENFDRIEVESTLDMMKMYH
ncbi:MAG: patatin-like phospholipase family protein [Rhodospirillaceae bacterium]|nr:MAG: patatin-like phospholipase family protein [Rhodospirillaceae bacterium]